MEIGATGAELRGYLEKVRAPVNAYRHIKSK
jgi:hypothetical protein